MRFTLRKFRKGDEHTLRKHIHDREIARNTLLIPYPYTSKDAEHWMRKCLAIYRKKQPLEIPFAIDIGGKVVGGIGIGPIDYRNKSAEFGYWLAKQYRNQGIMTRVIRRIVRYGFHELKLKRLYAKTFIFNRASQRVLEKAGFQLEGRLRKACRKNGKYYDSFLYAKVK